MAYSGIDINRVITGSSRAASKGDLHEVVAVLNGAIQALSEDLEAAYKRIEKMEHENSPQMKRLRELGG